MTGTTLTYEEWAALEDAEAPIYKGEQGAHAYTSVNDRRDSDPFLVSLWQRADDNVGSDAADLDEQETVEEIARRVAAALAVLAFGPDFIAAS